MTKAMYTEKEKYTIITNRAWHPRWGECLGCFFNECLYI